VLCLCVSLFLSSFLFFQAARGTRRGRKNGEERQRDDVNDDEVDDDNFLLTTTNDEDVFLDLKAPSTWYGGSGADNLWMVLPTWSNDDTEIVTQLKFKEDAPEEVKEEQGRRRGGRGGTFVRQSSPSPPPLSGHKQWIYLCE
jgi:hypothetical protein